MSRKLRTLGPVDPVPATTTKNKKNTPDTSLQKKTAPASIPTKSRAPIKSNKKQVAFESEDEVEEFGDDDSDFAGFDEAFAAEFDEDDEGSDGQMRDFDDEDDQDDDDNNIGDDEEPLDFDDFEGDDFDDYEGEFGGEEDGMDEDMADFMRQFGGDDDEEEGVEDYDDAGADDDDDDNNTAFSSNDFDFDDSAGSGMSLQDRLKKMLGGDALGGAGEEDLDHAESRLLFSSAQKTKKSQDGEEKEKQDKSDAIRKQLYLYQQQLRIRLMLQQPQGFFEQIPSNPYAFVQLTTLDMEDEGNVIVTTNDATQNKEFDLGFSSEATPQEKFLRGGKIRKITSLYNDEQYNTNGTSFDHDDNNEPGQVRYNVEELKQDPVALDVAFKHPLVKRAKLSQAVTAQTLRDLLQLEQQLAKGAGALEYDENLTEKQKNKSSNLSLTFLHDDALQQLLQSNQLLSGMTSKQTMQLFKEELEKQDDTTTTTSTTKKGRTLGGKKQSTAAIPKYEQFYEQLEDYLASLYTTSLPRLDTIIDKWEKRTNNALTNNLAGGDLSSLQIPISKQINATLTTEQKRLVQKTRLRRFTPHPLCTDQDKVKQEMGDVSSNQRFDANVFDDFDFTPALLKEMNQQHANLHPNKALHTASSHSSTGSGSGNDLSSLTQQQLQEQQDAVKRHLKQTTFFQQNGGRTAGNKRQVVTGVPITQIVNFMVPKFDLGWVRSNGLELNTSSELDTAAVKDRMGVDALLGTTTSDAIFVDNLLLHLFGQQQVRESKHVSAALDKEKAAEKERLAEEQARAAAADNGNDMDDEDDFDDEDGDDDFGGSGGDDDEDDDDEAEMDEFGGADMGKWFG